LLKEYLLVLNIGIDECSDAVLRQKMQSNHIIWLFGEAPGLLNWRLLSGRWRYFSLGLFAEGGRSMLL